MDLSTASQLLEGHLPLLRSGQLKVRLTFETLTTQSWNCVIWATYPALLEVNNLALIFMSVIFFFLFRFHKKEKSPLALLNE